MSKLGPYEWDFVINAVGNYHKQDQNYFLGVLAREYVQQEDLFKKPE